MQSTDTLSKRIYSALLLLYPLDLRRQFGREMLEVFSEQTRDAYQKKGWRGKIGVWRCVAGKTIRTFASSHKQTVGISLASVLACLRSHV